MDSFYTVYSLKKEIRKRAVKALQNEIKDYVVNRLESHIETDVYKSYSPVEYERRKEKDGLLSNNNIKSEVNDLTLTITEEAEIEGPRIPGYGKFPNKDGLAQLIEHGSHNPWNGKRFRWTKPRKFITNTQNDINYKYSKILKMLKKRIENDN